MSGVEFIEISKTKFQKKKKKPLCPNSFPEVAIGILQLEIYIMNYNRHRINL